jgi:hypothetical protein
MLAPPSQALWWKIDKAFTCTQMGLNPKPFLRSLGPIQGLYHWAITLEINHGSNLLIFILGELTYLPPSLLWAYLNIIAKCNYPQPHVVILCPHCFINNNIFIQFFWGLKLEKYCFYVFSHECIFKHKFYVHLFFFPSPFFPHLANMVAKHFWPIYLHIWKHTSIPPSNYNLLHIDLFLKFFHFVSKLNPICYMSYF